MFEDNFVLIVTIVALIYSVCVRALQFKLGNQKEMEALNKETKELNKEYKKASEEKNQAKMEAIMKKQQAVFPKMGKTMMGQFKVMAVVIVIFLGVTWVLSSVDPFQKDDALISLVDDGFGCDSTAGDLIYSGCYDLSGDNFGSWVVTVNAYKGDIFAQNSTGFDYKETTEGPLFLEIKGEPVGVSTDKEKYLPGETVKVIAHLSEKPEKVEARFNLGTWFYVDLPFTIPILNIQRIHQPYWWFITVTIVSGLIITPIYKKIHKKMEGDKDAITKEQV